MAFLTRSYASDFSEEAKVQLAAIMHDVNAVEERFEAAFEEDEILDLDALPAFVLQVGEFLG